ncbi:calponin homology domain-containing protein [Drosophila madeirensis]|uniref:Calponin homology domain-containing protein n=1 Tax=Drosophila madeirensis TaxID=30013 RepID=A0AAU9FLV6_DROMD
MDCNGAATAVLADDSGHFSCTSDEGNRTSLISDLQQGRVGGCDQEPEKSMFLVRQELLKSRSEIERLARSEQWYKQELKSQKHGRLETLERLYAQERKYLLENQKLQQESMRLHAKCASLERQQELGQPLSLGSSTFYTEDCGNCGNIFEAQQQEALLVDQRQLIDVLRKQKKMLLEDIQRLSIEHDEKLMQLQQALVGMELESKHMTVKCKQLLDEKSKLEYHLELRATALRGVTAEREQLRQVIAELNDTLLTQERLLALKEQEFLDLKQFYQQKLSKETSIDVMHTYSLKFHEEINCKTNEIATLKNSLNELQSELMVMSQLKAKNEEQQRQLEQLQFTVQAQLLEQEQLRQSDGLKLDQVQKLTISLDALHLEKATLSESLMEALNTLKNLEQEVHRLHRQYAEMCSKCEDTKLQLELEKIGLARLRQESSLRESALSEKLRDYADQCLRLGEAMVKAEARLDSQSAHAQKWKEQLKKMDQGKEKVQVNCQSQGMQTETIDPVLIQRIEVLERHLAEVKSQKMKTVSLLQKLLQQQDAKIKSTSEMEADWRQLLEALQATQQIEQEMRLQLQQKTVELDKLNELFARQNEELQNLQQLSLAKDQENRLELELLKEKFQENLQIHSADSMSIQRLQGQVKGLLEEREISSRQEHKAVVCLRSLVQVLEMETGRKLQSCKNWPQLAKLLRKELQNGRLSQRIAEQLPEIKLKLAEVTEIHEQDLVRIKMLETRLVAGCASFEASDSGKSTASTTPLEPAHEIANLIDDYKKLVQQTAKETGRPRNSYILDLIERSQRCQPNLCQLYEGVAACHSDMRQLNMLLAAAAGPEQAREVMPSLMEELRAVSDHSYTEE